jgi:hypothetical protein
LLLPMETRSRFFLAVVPGQPGVVSQFDSGFVWEMVSEEQRLHLE